MQDLNGEREAAFSYSVKAKRLFASSAILQGTPPPSSNNKPLSLLSVCSLSLEMSTTRRKLLLNTVTVNLGCSSCRRPKLSDIFHPKPKSKSSVHRKHDFSRSSYKAGISTYDDESDATAATVTTTFSPMQYSDTESDTRTVRGFGKIDSESVAVEKDSDDPYLDFRHSMLQMILENEIYSKEDLRELLNCFLQLNSPCLHGIIVRAFTEIWNGVFSVKYANAYSPKPRIGRRVT